MTEVAKLFPEAGGRGAANPPELAPADEAIPHARRSRRLMRGVLLGAVPLLVLAVATYGYLHAGRFVDTDNAYVKSDKAMVTAQITGNAIAVMVHDNDRVEVGEELLRIDPQPFELALARADAALDQARNEVAAMKVAYRQALAELELNEVNARYAATEHRRQADLNRVGIGTEVDLDAAEHSLDTALRQVDVAKQRAAQLLIGLHGNPDVEVELHPRYLEAKAARDAAALDLARTSVKAPFAGVVSNTPTVGDYIERGKPAMSLVADRGMWVEANFKETDLTHVRSGQAAEVSVDTYPGVQWQGRVQSISEATGAEFALLPAQNATGNWVKVVQRIPVRIVLDVHEGDPPLRAGMSATVKVDTEHSRGLEDLIPAG